MPMPVQPAAKNGVVLPAQYYRDNFEALCNTVRTHYGDLLLPAEQQFLAAFEALDRSSQCLYVRLVSRVGPVFRTVKLSYQEIGPLQEPVAALFERGLAEPVSALTVAELAGVYTRAELISVFGESLQLPVQCRKDLLLEKIDALDLEADELFDRLSGVDEAPVLRILGESVVGLLQLLFFGNGHQGLTDFVLSDLGVAIYYPYPLDRAHRLFSCRAALDEYIVIGQFSETFHQLCDVADSEGITVLAQEMLLQEVGFNSSGKRWQRVCLRVARELERNREAELALQLYGLCQRHPARDRTARIYESRQQWGEVIALCEGIQESPWCEAELEAANRIHSRARRKIGAEVVPVQRDHFEQLHLQVVPGGESVEQETANSIAADWTAVHYLENSLMNTLFGLAFWEQIFAEVSGAFHNPYQSVPADMYDAGFRARRSREIDARIESLRAADLRQELASCRQRFENYRCHWADWDRVSAEIQDIALNIIPAEHLLAIWQRILFDPGGNRSGFPDLIALGDHPGDYCMIEVKGPGDNLQDNQKRWLRYFAANNIPSKVAWVTWANV